MLVKREVRFLELCLVPVESSIYECEVVFFLRPYQFDFMIHEYGDSIFRKDL